jgi:hypothetical protein
VSATASCDAERLPWDELSSEHRSAAEPGRRLELLGGAATPPPAKQRDDAASID